MNILKKFFSVTTSKNYKVITILGIKMKFFSTRLYLKNLQKDLKPVLKYIKLSKRQLNRGHVEVYIEKFKKRGIIGVNTEAERTPRIIISLTSFPDRIGECHYSIFSLLNQTLKPDKVILWLASEQFPEGEDDVPQKILDYKNHGLTIKFTKDIKSYKKIIPALKEFPDDIIVSADDDIYYPQTWLEQLYNEYLQNPNNICAHRVHKVTLHQNGTIKPYGQWQELIEDESCSLLNFATTGGGILYPPHILYKDVSDENLFMSIAPSCDETWLWAMALLNNARVKVVKNPINYITLVNTAREAGFGNEITLTKENFTHNKKNIQIKNVIEHYPQILDVLVQEQKASEVSS